MLFVLRRAIQLYTEALDLDPENHILYTNRSAAYLKNGQVDKALADAVKARTVCPKWGKVRFFLKAFFIFIFCFILYSQL